MGTKKRIGDLLVEKGAIDRKAAETAVAEAALSDTRFASALVKSGRVKEVDVLQALAEQAGVPSVDLSRTIIAREALEKIPPTVANNHAVLPLQVLESNLLLAMANPRDQKTIDEVTFATGLGVLPLVALHHRLRQTIRSAYRSKVPYHLGPDADASKAQGAGFIPVVLPELSEPDKAAEPALVVKEEELSIEIEIEEVEEDDTWDGPTPRISRAQAEAGADEDPTGPRPILSESELAEGIAEDPLRVILVVDDEPAMLKLAVRTLEGLGHEIVTATTGTEALKQVKASKPDLIVLDAMLPEIHGFEICRKVKESKRFGSVPVLMVSAMYKGWRTAQDVKDNYGADAFLEKPYDIQHLLREAEKLLERGSSPEQDDELQQQARPRYEEGVTAYQDHDYERALRLLQSAAELAPFSPKIQFMIARTLECQDRPLEAILNYERAVDLSPGLFPACKNLALLYQENGFKNKAIEMWERALIAAPTDEAREKIRAHITRIL
ncbi:response regulator [Myxococcota bacterium]